MGNTKKLLIILTSLFSLFSCVTKETIEPSPTPPSPEPLPTIILNPEPKLPFINGEIGGEVVFNDDMVILIIPPNGISSDTEVEVIEVDDPSSEVTSELISEAYKIELVSDVEITKPIQIALKVPETEASVFANPVIIHWNESKWEFIESIESNGLVVTEMTELSTWGIGFKASFALERRDGTIESGEIVVKKDMSSGELVVYIYDSSNNLINKENVQDFRGGYIYHEDHPWQITWASIAQEMIRRPLLPIPVNYFLSCLIKQEIASITQIYDQTMMIWGEKKSTGWSTPSSTCYVGHGYEDTYTLSLDYGFIPGMSGYGPYFYINVKSASPDLPGDTILFLLYYEGELFKAFEMDVKDMIENDMTEGEFYHFDLRPKTTERVNFDIDKADLLAMLIGAPNVGRFEILKWDLWKDTRPRSLCVFGGDSPQLTYDDPCSTLTEGHWAYKMTSMSPVIAGWGPPESDLLLELWTFNDENIGIYRFDSFNCLAGTFSWSCSNGFVETWWPFDHYRTGVIQGDYISGDWVGSMTYITAKGTWEAFRMSAEEWDAYIESIWGLPPEGVCRWVIQ